MNVKGAVRRIDPSLLSRCVCGVCEQACAKRKEDRNSVPILLDKQHSPSFCKTNEKTP